MEISNNARVMVVTEIKNILDTHDFLSTVDVTSFDHNFKGFGTHPSKIRVHLLRNKELTVVVFEDLGIGTSVTNASEQLATEIGNALKLDPLKTAWMEYYPYYTRAGNRLDMDRITYTYTNGKYYKPEWHPVENEMIERFIRRLAK